MRRSLASRPSASLADDAWLICAASSAVKMPFACKTRTSGLTAGLLSVDCCVQLQSYNAMVSRKHTTTQNGLLLISNPPSDSALECQPGRHTLKAPKRLFHILLLLDCQEI